MKYIFWLFLLLGSNILLAQEVNNVIYKRHQREIIIKKSGKKKIRHGKTVVEDREAQLIYTPDCLLFKSSQGTDTVLLSKINQSMRHSFLQIKMFYVIYNDKADCITLLFCKRKQGKKFKKFMLNNGGQYKRYIGADILLGSLLVVLAPVFVWNPFESSLPPVWRKWRKTCKASEK